MGGITKGSARALVTAVQRDRERRSGDNGESAEELQLEQHRFYFGETQAQINANQSGPVNIWAGAKGSETDTKVTIPKVFCRQDFAPNGIPTKTKVIFAVVDRGPEIIVANPCNTSSS
jgi:hypothetical protein